jgi:hypothetical protein
MSGFNIGKVFNKNCCHDMTRVPKRINARVFLHRAINARIFILVNTSRYHLILLIQILDVSGVVQLRFVQRESPTQLELDKQLEMPRKICLSVQTKG